MIKTSIVVLAVAVASTAPAQAFGFGDELDRYEQRKVLEAEFERSSQAGGYSDPITAIIELFAGDTKEKDVQTPITNGQDAEQLLYGKGTKPKRE
ncbi:MAG: hypothetical protein AAGD13_20845 [Pseudomonadota bacterium]